MPTFLVLLLLAQIPNLPSMNGTVTGVLRTAEGKPATGVRVSAVVPPAADADAFKATAMASIAETDAEGRYRLEGVPPGRYYISAGRIDLPTYYPGSSILSEGTLVLVTPGSTVANVDFVLRNESAGRSASSNFMYWPLGSPPGFHIPVTIDVEGGGKFPVFQNGSYPVIRATNVSSKNVIEILLSATLLTLPLPSGSTADEYNVSVNDLLAYGVKSFTYGSADLQKETLKVPGQGLSVQQQGLSVQQARLGLLSSGPGVSGSPLTVVLTKTPAAPTIGGVRVSGRGAGAGEEIYISGTAGTLYSDGTFEFQGVAPGLHKVVKLLGNTATAGAAIVGDGDVDDLVLRRPQLLPIDVFEEPSKPPNGNIPDSKALPMLSIAGRVIDEASQESLEEGAVTITGYGNVRRVFAIIAGAGFTINDLLPGTYNLTINVTGYQSTTQAVTVGVEDLKLDLSAVKGN